MTPFVLCKSKVAADQYDLMVYGDIGESWVAETVSAKNVAGQIQALDPNVKQINIRVNSFGGSVADGIAIHNALRQHPAKKHVVIDGVAMSIASLIAMAGDVVEVFESSVFMLHAPWASISGNAAKLREYADVLDTFAEAMVGAYTRKTGKDAEAIRALLTDGKDHYFTAQEAMDFKLADVVKQDKKKAKATGEARVMAAAMVQRYLVHASDKVADMAISATLQAPTLDVTMEEPVTEPAAEAPEAPMTEAEAAAFDAAVAEEVAPAPTPAPEAPAPDAKLDVVKALEAQLAAAKAEAETQVRAAKAEAEALARSLADEKEKAEIQASIRSAAEIYGHLPGKAEDLGPALRLLAKAAPEAHATIKAVLDSVNGLLANAEKVQMASIGKGGDEPASPEARLEIEVKKAREKNPNLTVEQAKAAIYRANPNLVRELRGEKD